VKDEDGYPKIGKETVVKRSSAARHKKMDHRYVDPGFAEVKGRANEQRVDRSKRSRSKIGIEDEVEGLSEMIAE
jgi:hypothetical protein